MEYRLASDELKEKHNVETGKTDRHDIDWRVEQRLAKVLAERDLYIEGFVYGFFIALIVGIALAVSFWPEPILKRVK